MMKMPGDVQRVFGVLAECLLVLLAQRLKGLNHGGLRLSLLMNTGEGRIG